MAKSDIGYYNGLVASAYKTLIPRDKMLRLVELDPDEILRTLKEYGYTGDEQSPKEYQALIEREKQKLLRFVADGEFGSQADAFCLLKSDYHNAECILRERFSGDLGNVYGPIGKCSLEQLKSAVLDRNSDVTDGIKKSMKHGAELYASGRASGSAITTLFMRNYYAELLHYVKSPRLRKIIRFEIDAKNCSVALRSNTFAVATSMILGGGTLTDDDLEVLYRRDEHEITLRFAYTPLYDYIRTAFEEKASGKPMLAFERAADDYALNVMDDVRYETSGITPIIMYYLYKTAEMKNIRTIMSLRLNGASAEEITARLRKGYVG